MKVEILAVKDKSLFGRLISFVRRSKVSHAAVRVNGWVYEMGLKSPQKLEDHLYRWNYEVIHEVHMAKETFNERLKSMQSAKYDYLAILAFYINRKFGKTGFNKS